MRYSWNYSKQFPSVPSNLFLLITCFEVTGIPDLRALFQEHWSFLRLWAWTLIFAALSSNKTCALATSECKISLCRMTHMSWTYLWMIFPGLWMWNGLFVAPAWYLLWDKFERQLARKVVKSTEQNTIICLIWIQSIWCISLTPACHTKCLWPIFHGFDFYLNNEFTQLSLYFALLKVKKK